MSVMSSPNMWDLVAIAYDNEVVPMFETFARKALELAQVAPGARIIDVACGPGTLAIHAARGGHPVQAIDYSPKMIERLVAKDIAGITAQVGDGEHLPFESAMFGGAFSLFGLIFFDDRAKGFAELRRVLEPNAKAVVTSWPGLDESPLFAAVFGAMRDALIAAGVHSTATPPVLPGLTTVDDFYREMSVSFRDVAISRVAHTALFPSIEELASSLIRTIAPIAIVRETIGFERFIPIDAAIRDAIARYLGSAPPAIELNALFGVGSA